MAFPLHTTSALEPPDTTLNEGRYVLRFAHTSADLDALARLRFEVFNLELGEGLEASYASGKDEDLFDPICHHLMICDQETGDAIGTYRLQTYEMAEQSGHGFYSATLFDFSTLPPEVLQQSVEIGRACIAKDHRSLQVLYLLWRGLGSYLAWFRKRYLFGCCSLTSQDAHEGKRVMDFLVQNGHIHASLYIGPEQGMACYDPDLFEGEVGTTKVPRLMRVYLSMGAKICGPPAIDRQFKTIDYFTLIDVETLDRRVLAFFGYH
jgi:putative hemolysin